MNDINDILEKAELTIDTNINYLKTFEIYKLVPENDPVLRQATKPFDFANQPTPAPYIAQSLLETMFEHKGLGLSANQVGIPYSIFAVGFDKKNCQIFFNPQIIEQSEETELGMEGCLSFPNLFIKIRRPKHIKVRFNFVDGRQDEHEYSGFTARVIMHEDDHLRGITFKQRAGELSLKMAMQKRAKIARLKKKIADDEAKKNNKYLSIKS